MVYTSTRQDQTSQDHFCSVIDEFPVWNSEPDQPTRMSWAASSEREKELKSTSDLISLMIAHLSYKRGGRTCCCLSGFIKNRKILYCAWSNFLYYVWNPKFCLEDRGLNVISNQETQIEINSEKPDTYLQTWPNQSIHLVGLTPLTLTPVSHNLPAIRNLSNPRKKINRELKHPMRFFFPLPLHTNLLH